MNKKDIIKRIGKLVVKKEVSVLMAVHNTKPGYIKTCWESILSQLLRNWELVLVDDGSTDEKTIQVIDEISAYSRVKLIRLPVKTGAAIARNIGLEQCESDLVAIMDSDDIAKPEWLSKQVNWMKNHPDVAAVGVQIICFNANGKKTYYINGKETYYRKPK